MLNFQMNMPYYLMAFYGSIMILAVLLLRVTIEKQTAQVCVSGTLGRDYPAPADSVFTEQPAEYARSRMVYAVAL